MPITRGVKKVSENIVAVGRAIILTEQDRDKYKWSEIPVGSKFIDIETGIESVKLKDVLMTTGTYPIVLGPGVIKDGLVYYPDGITPIKKIDGTQYTSAEVEFTEESDWVPAGIKNDGTLCIAKDALVAREVFTIVNPDEGDGNFSYKNSKGEMRHMPITDHGYMFELEEGTYQLNRNHLEVMIDDCLLRNATSGGIIEHNDRRFILTDDTLESEQEISARYFRIVRIGNPYPRIFITDVEPDTAEIGDLWIDTDYVLQDWDKYLDDDGKLDWSIIKNFPRTLAGLGITDDLAPRVHLHKYSDIEDAPDFNHITVSNAATAGRLLNARNITLTGLVSGSAAFDGSADANIATTIDDSTLQNAIINIVGTDDVVGLMRSSTSRVSILTGQSAGTVGLSLPVPDGYDRSECTFFITAARTTGAFSLTFDAINGFVTSNSAVSGISYLVIGCKNGGIA